MAGLHAKRAALGFSPCLAAEDSPMQECAGRPAQVIEITALIAKGITKPVSSVTSNIFTDDQLCRLHGTGRHVFARA
jgi:hypothetical protein